MPWQEVDTVSLRAEFVQLAQAGGVGMAELCRRFGISRKTGYKWVQRGRDGEAAELRDRSRRPRHSPGKTAGSIEARIVRLRRRFPAWGPRKLRRLLVGQIGQEAVPAVSTVAAILQRQGLIDPQQSAQHAAYVRFEHAAPNDLWQMDFLGHFATATQRCHTLTALDDHSRFNLVLSACADQNTATVRERLIGAFRLYGLPLRISVDNGPPWGNSTERHDLTPLVVWLMRLGVSVSHSRPFHPQTQGKDERFHRTLRAEVLNGRHFADLPEVQHSLDRWRPIYNGVRPHQALNLQVPRQRYRCSPRPYPERLPPLEYGPEDQVRKVQDLGWMNFAGHPYKLPRALKGQPVALRATPCDGIYEVYFGRHKIQQINLHQPQGSQSQV